MNIKTSSKAIRYGTHNKGKGMNADMESLHRIRGETTPETNKEKHLTQSNLNSNNLVESFNIGIIYNQAIENTHIEEKALKIKVYFLKQEKKCCPDQPSAQLHIKEQLST